MEHKNELSRRRLIGRAAGTGAGIAVVAALPLSAAGAATSPHSGEVWPIEEPYPVLHGGRFKGRRVRASKDPLVQYRWPDPQPTDGLQIYQLRPRTVDTAEPDSFARLQTATQPRCNVTVRGVGSIRFDFGIESPAWLEFDSPDFSGQVEMSISEYNRPARVNPGPQHPVKTLTPERIGNTFRLRLNADLFEGVRFGWIHVRTFDRPWHITDVRLVCQAKPTNYRGSFSCSDPQLTRIWYAGAYGMRVAFQEDHIGAILMDRGDRHSWSGDCYPVQAASMIAFGNWDFVKANLARTADVSNGIEIYSLYWVLSLLDYYNHTGDTETLTAHIGGTRAKLDRGNGRYDNPTNGHFYGWDERLGGGFDEPDNPETARVYRMVLITACRGFAAALDRIGRADVAEIYRGIADARIEELRSDPAWFESFGIHSMADAIKADVVTADERDTVYEQEFADRLNRLSFSPFNQYFILQAMTTLDQTDDALVTVDDNWGGQLTYGGTTFFEVFRPDWLRVLGTNDAVPNSQSGWTSLAHPWSSGITAWLSHDILGITPSSPGFDTVDIFPRPGRSLGWVSGSVPTPHGDVSAEIDVDSGRGEIVIPRGARGRIGVPSGGREITKVRVNGRVVWDGRRFHRATGIGGAKSADDDVVLSDVAPGRYALKVSYRGRRKPHRTERLTYPTRLAARDTTTKGSWGGVYGQDGHVLFNYDGPHANRQKSPPYIRSVKPSRGTGNSCLDTQWVPSTDDLRALAPGPDNGGPRTAACIYSRAPVAMTMIVDVAADPGAKYRLGMYFVDWDSTSRQMVVEVFDMETLEVLAPVEMVEDFHDGVYLVYPCDRSVRLRIAHVDGDNCVLSGLFFDPV